MRDYELMLIVRSNLDEKVAGELVDAIAEQFKTSGGQVTAIKNWGRRKLAYPIKNQLDGIYFLLKVSVAPAAIKAIDFNLKLNENLLRHMFVKDEGFEAVEKPAKDTPTDADFADEDDYLDEVVDGSDADLDD